MHCGSITFANISLAKESHVVEPRVGVDETLQSYVAKSLETERGEEFGSFLQSTILCDLGKFN